MWAIGYGCLQQRLCTIPYSASSAPVSSPSEPSASSVWRFCDHRNFSEWCSVRIWWWRRRSKDGGSHCNQPRGRFCFHRVHCWGNRHHSYRPTRHILPPTSLTHPFPQVSTSGDLFTWGSSKFARVSLPGNSSKVSSQPGGWIECARHGKCVFESSRRRI